MNREFGVGDIANLSNGRKVRGILNYNTETETYKNFILKYKAEVKIIGYAKADEKTCGGYIYDCEVSHKGVSYRIECIPQFHLFPKKMWQNLVDAEQKIKELEKSITK